MYKKPKRTINFYELDEVKELQKEYHNPNYDADEMSLKHPLRLLLLGSSGSGKSNVLLNIIHQMSETFNGIRLFTANSDEPLYNFLKKKIPQLIVYEGLEEFRKMNIEEEFQGQELLIFDDIVLEKDQKKIEELFIRGRKLSNNEGLSVIYLSQIYHKIPRPIRLQATDLILKKLGSNMDIKRILGDRSMGDLKPKDIINMFNYCVDGDITNFLHINLTEQQERMFRNGFDEILDAEEFIE